MAANPPGEASAPRDATFRSYSADQAATYAKMRMGYSQEFLDHVLHHHTSTGGKLELLLDVGCGPGNATRDLARYFDAAVGCDPGKEMIAQAKTEGYKSKNGQDVVFEQCAAEELQNLKSVKPGSVDLIICAMSIHWFQLEKFYPAAAHVLKPGGSIAAWTRGSLFVHPDIPNAAVVQKHLSHLEDVVLGPYNLPGNRLSYHVYDHLDLPWTLQPAVCETELPESGLYRKVWNRGGRLEDGKTAFLDGEKKLTLAQARKMLGTASMVTRWREANGERVARGEIKDCLDETFDNVREAIGLSEEKEKTFAMPTGSATGLVILKRA